MMKLVPGLVAAVGLACIAVAVAGVAPILGAPVLALVLGVVLSSLLRLPAVIAPGIVFSGRYVLQASIVVSGFAVSLRAIVETGISSLPLMLGTMAIAFAVAFPLARLCGVTGALRPLVAVGTSICGASAIAAASSVLEPTEDERALATATIFFYNVAGVLTFGPIAHWLALSQRQFGIWAGTAINDTSSVVAAAFAYGAAAGTEGTIVKLTRALLILPVVGALAAYRAKRARWERHDVRWSKITPWFVVWFVGAATANTAGLVPPSWHLALSQITTFAISVALAGIGLQTPFRTLSRAGAGPLAYGLGLWLAVTLSSLVVVRASGP